MNSTNTGIMVTWLGSIIVASRTTKSASRPRQRSLAKAKATTAELAMLPIMASTVTVTELRKKSRKAMPGLVHVST